MPICLVVASGRPARTEVEAVPRRHILEPSLPTMGTPQARRAFVVWSTMKARVMGVPRGAGVGEEEGTMAAGGGEGRWMRKTGSSGPVGNGDLALRSERREGTQMEQPGSSG